MSFKFKPEQVEKLIRLASTGPSSMRWEAAADLLDKQLDEHLATLPKLYCTKNEMIGLKTEIWSEHKGDLDTKQGILWGIAPLEKKECEHEPIYLVPGILMGEGKYIKKCKHCGVKLKAKWEKA